MSSLLPLGFSTATSGQSLVSTDCIAFPLTHFFISKNENVASTLFNSTRNLSRKDTTRAEEVKLGIFNYDCLVETLPSYDIRFTRISVVYTNIGNSKMPARTEIGAAISIAMYRYSSESESMVVDLLRFDLISNFEMSDKVITHLKISRSTNEA